MARRTPQDAQKTREGIKQAALEVFCQKGVYNASLDDIARKAGVTRGAIYWHFRDKAELIAELCRDVVEQHGLSQALIQAARDDEPDPLGKLREWLLRHGTSASVAFFTSTVASVLDNLLFPPGQIDSLSAVRSKLQSYCEDQHFYLRNALMNCVRKGQLPEDLDPVLASDLMRMFIVGYIECARMGWDVKLREHFPEVVDRLLRNICEITRKPAG